MAVLVSGSEIVLSGTVGDLFWSESFTAGDVIAALAQVGRENDVTIRLNSGGGIATEGSAIHSALVAHRGKKTIIVEGIAASAASIIAMAGDDVVMSLGALMMVHDPSGFTYGTVEDHELQVRALTAFATAMAGIYADQTGKSLDEARADMRAELWMTPEEAVSRGYADRIAGRPSNDNSEPTAFDYRLYHHPPEPIVALADQRAWTKRAPLAAAHPATTPRRKDTPMATAPAGTVPAPQPSTPPANPGAVPAGSTAAQPVALSRADAAEIAKLCVDGGVPAMASTLLAEGATVAQARERIGAAGRITDMVALARRQNSAIPETMAATMIAEGKSVEQARTALFDKLVADQEAQPTASHVPAGNGGVSGANAMQASMTRILGSKGLTATKGA